MKVLFITLSLCFLTHSAIAACLAKDTLTKLFPSALDAPATNTEACTGLFDKGDGACVAGKDVKTSIEETNSALAKAYSSIEDLPSYYEEIKKFFVDIAGDSITKEQTDLITAGFDFLDKQIKDNEKPCLDALANIQQGFLCYAASAQASEKSVDTDDLLTVKTLPASLTSLNSCYWIFVSFCMLSTPDNPTVAFNPNPKPVNAELDRRCAALKADPLCNSDSVDKCPNVGGAVGKYFFEVKDINYFPTKEQIQEAKDALEDIKKLVEAFAGANREAVQGLADRLSGLSAKGTTALESDENGVDLKTYGDNSKVEFKHSLISHIVAIGVFFATFI